MTGRPPRATASPGRRFGYLIAATINAVFLAVVDDVVHWDRLTFLTDEVDRVLPIVRVSLAAGLAANLLYLFFDPPWFKSLTQIGLSAIALAVAVRTYRVFPFDFSAYEFNWAATTRTVLIITMVALGLAILAEVVKLVGTAGAGRDASG
jgi:hypothetical protein